MDTIIKSSRDCYRCFDGSLTLDDMPCLQDEITYIQEGDYHCEETEHDRKRRKSSSVSTV